MATQARWGAMLGCDNNIKGLQWHSSFDTRSLVLSSFIKEPSASLVGALYVRCVGVPYVVVRAYVVLQLAKRGKDRLHKNNLYSLHTFCCRTWTVQYNTLYVFLYSSAKIPSPKKTNDFIMQRFQSIIKNASLWLAVLTHHPCFVNSEKPCLCFSPFHYSVIAMTVCVEASAI